MRAASKSFLRALEKMRRADEEVCKCGLRRREHEAFSRRGKVAPKCHGFELPRAGRQTGGGST